MVKRGDMMSIEDVVDILAIDLIGAIPDDENIVISTNNGEPIVIKQDVLSGQAIQIFVNDLWVRMLIIWT